VDCSQVTKKDGKGEREGKRERERERKRNGSSNILHMAEKVSK
jgi:hypothetical protein